MSRYKFGTATVVALGVMCAALGWAGSAGAHTFQDLQNVEDEIVNTQAEIADYNSRLADTSNAIQQAEHEYELAEDLCTNNGARDVCESQAYGAYLDAIGMAQMDAEECYAALSALDMELSDLQAEYAAIYHELYG